MTGIVSTRDVADGSVVHHMGAFDGSNYGTLCGVSTDDDMYAWIDTPSGQKINCKHCVSIWRKAKEFESSQFAKQLV